MNEPNKSALPSVEELKAAVRARIEAGYPASFHFTWDDVDLLMNAAKDYGLMAKGAAEWGEDGSPPDEWGSRGFQQMEARHRSLADRIAALLPPRET